MAVPNRFGTALHSRRHVPAPYGATVTPTQVAAIVGQLRHGEDLFRRRGDLGPRGAPSISIRSLFIATSILTPVDRRARCLHALRNVAIKAGDSLARDSPVPWSVGLTTGGSLTGSGFDGGRLGAFGRRQARASRPAWSWCGSLSTVAVVLSFLASGGPQIGFGPLTHRPWRIPLEPRPWATAASPWPGQVRCVGVGNRVSFWVSLEYLTPIDSRTYLSDGLPSGLVPFRLVAISLPCRCAIVLTGVRACPSQSG